MKFKVREGFHATIREIALGANGEKEIQDTRIHGGKTADFDDVNARRQLHMLEPADKDARDWYMAHLDAHRGGAARTNAAA